MQLTGQFELDRGGAVTLVLRNEDNIPLYVFVPHGRDYGVRVEVLSGPCATTSLGSEPEAGLVGETTLQPGEAMRHEYPLSSWIRRTGDGPCVVRLSVDIETATESLRVNRARKRAVVTIANEVTLTS